ncbi:fimbrial biogenesis outer membrane usher protein [Yersinia enterocolitica]|uniref:fimbria/pilus outer membrane usher protein n=1 Tax=Yersinia enterocolitica TaxID=630 RepID=UPI001C8EC258|nr:fimbria/pilus outer membrane usher protein [Yersinia enterocolitica]MBX9487349.1 fimbrial biogenesis outer membrane usher protein [Yersinia enterocolitica]MBX9490739.1 fimbrial biogenesis outer membrane usher protein [Yersinia enterocolitica]
MNKNQINGIILSGVLLSLLPTASADDTSLNVKKNVKFDSAFMNFFDHGLNLADYNGEDKVKEGKYLVDINLNSKNIDQRHVNFILKSNTQDAQACFKQDDIISFDIDTTLLSEGWKDNKCIFMADIIPGATVKFDNDDQKIFVTVPQVYLKNTPRGYITPELWDEGIPALTLSYGVNAATLRNTNTYGLNAKNEQFYYGSLNSSLKFDAWRLFTNSTLNSSSSNGTNFNNQSAYLQRSIAANLSQLAIGDVNTTGIMFNTTPVRGVSMYTDDRMLPDSMRGFAPTVRGIADSNALVTVMQNGTIIYETNVPPGEFVISDLNTSGYSGSIEVIIREANGNIRTQTFPYSSIPQLLRAGYSKYSTTFGEIRNSNFSDTPVLFEGTYQYGFNDYITAYGGVQTTMAGDYSAINGGVAINTTIGALGLDLTRSFHSVGAQEQECNSFCSMSVKASLVKFIEPTNTNFSLMAYRYSSSDYYTLMDALYILDSRKKGQNVYTDNYREVFEASISQELEPGWGSFNLSSYYGKYWQESQNNNISYQVGYANNLGSVNYNLSYNRANNRYGYGDNIFRLSFSIPISLGNRNSSKPILTSSLSHSEKESRIKTSVNGIAGSNQQYSYGSWIGAGSRGDNDFGLNGGYNSGSALINAGYSQGTFSSMASLNISGGVVAHAGGINLSHSISDTVGIVEAKGATGASVFPYSNSRVAKNGYAIIPSLNPFMSNEITINSKNAPTNIEIEEDRIKVVPTAGASVLIKFEAKSVNDSILKVKRKSGVAVPFGSIVYNQKGTSIGIIGQGGNVILSENTLQEMSVVWTEKEGEKRCFIEYAPDNDGNDKYLKTINALCKNEEHVLKG